MTDTTCIEFDGTVLSVTGNVPEIHRYLRRTYSRMASATNRQPDATMEITAAGNQLEMRSDTISRFDLESPGQLIPLLKEKIIETFMRSRKDLLWLHAGAAERNGKAVMVVGASGSGKSTIVTHLCDGGWRFISDDVAPIQMPAMKVIPFIQAPSRRIFPGTVIDSSELGSVDREEVALLDRQLAEAPCPIGAVVFPEFDLSSAAGLSRMSPGDGALGLLKYVRNFGDHLQHAVEQAALLARQVPMFRLCYNSGETAAAEIIDLL